MKALPKDKRYAYGTKVTADSSLVELKRLLTKHGAVNFATMESAAITIVVFELFGRRLKFTVPRPKNDEPEYFRLWRVLILRIKSRLEETHGGDVTVDEAFMSYIMLPNGHTVGESVLPAIESSYSSGKMPRLLLDYRGNHE